MAVSLPGARTHLSGKRALITGGSSGVGLEIARLLAAGGAHVLLPVRDRTKGERAVAEIERTVPEAHVEPVPLDLADRSSVRALATGLAADDRPLDILVLNAGVAMLGAGPRRATADGFEVHFQTNFLGHAELVLALVPRLRESRARIVVQSSLASALYGPPDPDDDRARRYSALRAYGSSKTALGLFCLELARRTAEVRVDLCHPGVVPATAIAQELRERVPAPLRDWAVRTLWNPPAQAASTALLALTTDAPAPVFAAPGGLLQFAGPARLRRPFRRLRDERAAQRVWDVVAELSATR